VETMDRTLEVTGHLTVDVKLATGDITVVEGRPGAVRVELQGTGDVLERFRIDTIERDGGTRLLVHAPEQRFRLRGRGDVRVQLTVPAGSSLAARVAAADVHAPIPLSDVTVQAAAGDVRVATVDGLLEVSSAAGDVEAGDVQGAARVTTASGDVRLGAIAGPAQVRTVSGDVWVRRSVADLTTRSVSGDVMVTDLVGGAVSVSTTSGEVDLTIAPGKQVHLDISTVTGELRSELQDDGGRAGSEVDIDLRCRSVSGGVRLRRGQGSPGRPGGDGGPGGSRGVAIV
jgi:hypothetical protein